MESLYESWAKRNPSWERRYQSTVVDVFCDYGKGVSSFLEARGKIFGAGYEIFIIAFFIGLYHNRTKPLIEDRDKKKVFGQAIQYWGNIENRIGRTSYGKSMPTMALITLKTSWPTIQTIILVTLRS